MILTILRILYLRLRNNPLELLLVFVMPVIFFSIFAAIFSNGIATGSDKKLRIGWIADSSTALGDELREFLEKNSSLQCMPLTGDSTALPSTNSQTFHASDVDIDAETNARIADAQRSGRYDLIVRLPSDFPADLPAVNANANTSPACSVILVTDGQNPMAVAMVTSVVNGFFSQKRATLIAQQLKKIGSSSPITRDPGSIAESDRQAAPSIDPYLSTSTQPPLKYLGPLKDPSESIVRGLRFYDPIKSQSWPLSERLDNFGRGDDLIAHSRNQPNTISTDPAFRPEAAVRPEVGSRPDTKPRPGVEITVASGSESSSKAEKLDPAALLEKQLTESPSTVNISVENPQSANQANPRIAMYAAGIAVLFLLFSSTGNAAALLEESESGTLDRILISKAGLFQIIAGKWLGIFLLGCIQICVMFLWAELIFKIQLWNHLPGFAVMTLCTAAATSSFAMLLATLCNSRAQLNAVSVVVILSMSAVGGSMIPRFAMSDRMKEIGQWTFNAWALDGYQKVFWFQSPISTLQTEVTVLLGSAVVFGTLASILSLRWKYS